MLRGSLQLAFLLILAALSGGAASQPPAPPEEEEEPIIVTGRRPPIMVTAPPRCRRRSGDPLDAVAVPEGRTRQSVLSLDASGQASFRREDEPVLGPAVWQRAGNAIGDYMFRVPNDGALLCIGAGTDNPKGWGQLRQIVKSGPYKGQYVRLTAWVATRAAREVRFWLTVGDAVRIRSGGDTSQHPIQGTNGWIPISLFVGPISADTEHISYGFLLYGSGDVWVTGLKLESITWQEWAKGGPAADLAREWREGRAPDKGDRRELDRKVLEKPPK